MSSLWISKSGRSFRILATSLATVTEIFRGLPQYQGKCHNSIPVRPRRLHSISFRFQSKLIILQFDTRRQDSSVDIAMRSGQSTQFVFIAKETRRFSTACRPELGQPQLPFWWIQGALSPSIKRPGLEAPFSVEVKNGGTIPPLPGMSPCLRAQLV
jgi:hypothetical protein